MTNNGRKIVLIFSFYSFLLIFFSCGTNVHATPLIADLSENFETIEHNLNKGIFMPIFELYAVYESKTYAEIEALLQDVDQKTFPCFHEFLLDLKAKKVKDNLFLLEQNIFVNNVPEAINAPFGEKAQTHHKTTFPSTANE